MKRIINFLIVGLMMLSAALFAQKPGDDRMKRDIAVMETALSEMLKQEFNQRNFFFMDIKGNYIPGYGVTFTVPTSMLNQVWGNGKVVVDVRGNGLVFNNYSYSHDFEVAEEAAGREKKKDDFEVEGRENKAAKREMENAGKERSTPGAELASPRGRIHYNSDSMTLINHAKIIQTAKVFIADYGDMLSQLAPQERIVVTNRGTTDNQFWFYGKKAKRSLLTVEAMKADLTSFRQGKINREQLINKFKTINTSTAEKSEPDLELLVSIFNRLYEPDLSKTYYMNGQVYYERLTDFGAILHMQVYSSSNMYNGHRGAEELTSANLAMPTLGLENLTQEERDKKVKELYPLFEKELKENLLEYGRTLKSLKDTEQLMVDVTMTKCRDCNIPATLELSVKASVLKEYSAGKLDKTSALTKIEVRKGLNQ